GPLDKRVRQGGAESLEAVGGNPRERIEGVADLVDELLDPLPQSRYRVALRPRVQPGALAIQGSQKRALLLELLVLLLERLVVFPRELLRERRVAGRAGRGNASFQIMNLRQGLQPDRGDARLGRYAGVCVRGDVQFPLLLSGRADPSQFDDPGVSLRTRDRQFLLTDVERVLSILQLLCEKCIQL